MNGTSSIKRQILCWLLLLCSSWGANLSAQTYQPILEVDSACTTVTVYMIDSLGHYDAAEAPYLLEYANLPAQQNNAVAFWRFPVGNLLNGRQLIEITDRNGDIYIDSVLFTCGVAPATLGAAITSNTPATSCNGCDGTATVTINSPANQAPFILKWSDGRRDTTSSTLFTKGNFCPGNVHVVVEDSAGQRAASATIILCPRPLPVLQCLDTFDVALRLPTATFTLYPRDVITQSANISPNYQLGTNQGIFTTTYTMDCSDLGLHDLTVLAVDTFNRNNITCKVLVRVREDVAGVCSNANGIQGVVNDTVRAASNCSTCDGFYRFVGILDTTTGALTDVFDYTYTWNDGAVGAIRRDLCPNQRYELTIRDSVGVSRIIEIQTGCPNNTCFDSSLVDPTFYCSRSPLPVCGCDGRTYFNSCVAEHEYGVTSWTLGPCAAFPLRIDVQTTPNRPCDTLICTGAINLTASGGTPPYRYFWSQGATTGLVTGLCSGTYMVTVVDANSRIANQAVFVGQDGCVWPGDADNNGVANHLDLLNIGLGYGAAGPARAIVNDAWLSQAASLWNDSTPQSRVNYRHLDCNGDGVIDSIDVNAIQRNYGRYYARTGQYSPPGNVPFYVEDGNGFAGDVVRVPIVLGDSAHPATNVYGVAFTLHYDERYVDTAAVAIDFNNSWLSSAGSILSVQRDFRRSGEVEVAITRVDQQAIGGIGPIAAVNFTIKDDLFMGRLSMDSIVTPFNITGVRIIDQWENLLGYNTRTGILQLNELLNARKLPDAGRLTVFPNPVQDELHLIGDDASLEYLRLYAADGQLILERALDVSPSTEYSISTRALPVGMYFLEVQTDKGVWQEKIHVQR